MDLTNSFKDMIKGLSIDKLLDVATAGVCQQVYYRTIDDKTIYCFKHFILVDNLVYVITDNPTDLARYILGYLLNKGELMTNNMLYFEVYDPTCEQYTHDVIHDKQHFECFPSISDCWCNRIIKNKKSLIEWIQDKLDKQRLDKLKEAIKDDIKEFIVYGNEINEYIKYVFGEFDEYEYWSSIRAYDL